MTKSRAQQILQAQIDAKQLQDKANKEKAKSLWERLGKINDKTKVLAELPKERFLKKASGKGLPNFNYLKNKIL